jgi:hypothetical protein
MNSLPKNSSGGTPILVPPGPVNSGHRLNTYNPIEVTASVPMPK